MHNVTDTPAAHACHGLKTKDNAAQLFSQRGYHYFTIILSKILCRAIDERNSVVGEHGVVIYHAGRVWFRENTEFGTTYYVHAN